MSAVIGGIWAVLLLVWLGRYLHARRGKIFARGKVAGHDGPSARSFRGRAGRREWWIATLWNALVAALLGLIPLVGGLLAFPWLVANWAVGARRLHDLHRSGWLQVVPTVLAMSAYIAVQVSENLGFIRTKELMALDSPIKIALASIVAAVCLVLLVFYAWLGFARGDKGPNHYGEADPA